MFTSTLFTIARNLKQPSCLSTDEEIMNMWYSYTMKYHSDVKRNGLMKCAGKCMDL